MGKNPAEDWISPVARELVNALDIMVKGVFEEHGFVESFVKNIDDWDAWRNSFEPHKEPLPGEWGDDSNATEAIGEPGEEGYVVTAADLAEDERKAAEYRRAHRG